MRKSIIHSTQNNNSYLYDTQHMFSMLIHPELKKAHEKSTEIDSYYSKKYTYLKEHDFFGTARPFQFEAILSENIVKDNIIRTKQIVFETTDHCNLKCQYCSLGKLYNFSKNESKNINTEYALNFLKYIFEIKQKRTKLAISFFGGEPLVNFHFIERIIEEAKLLNSKKELDLTFNMTTNATLIDKYIDYIVCNNIRLLISLDGDEEAQSYRTYADNNKNSFHKVIKNLDMIQQKYPEYFINQISFNAVLHNRNSVKSIYNFIYNKYHKIPRISQLNPDHINPEKKDIFKEMFHGRMESEIEFQKEDSNLLPIVKERLIPFDESKKFLKNYSLNFYLSNLLNLLYDQLDSIPTGTCLPFQTKMFLNTCHDLLPCEKVSYKHSLGKVDNQISIDIKRITQKYNSYFMHCKNVCQHCYSGKACSTCLLNLENLEKSDMGEFVCPDFQDEEAFKNKLYRIFSYLEKSPNDFFQIINQLIFE